MVGVGSSLYDIAYHKIHYRELVAEKFTKNDAKFKITIWLSQNHDKVTNKIHK